METIERIERLRSLVAACHSEACAPPPLGTGGSLPSIEYVPDRDSKYHTVVAKKGEEVVGTLLWSKKDGKIRSIDVSPDHQRQGIATALWEHANQRPGMKPRHSPDRTRAGDAWAKSVSSRVPAMLPSISRPTMGQIIEEAGGYGQGRRGPRPREELSTRVERLRAIVAACHSEACAPPPAGTGGSLPGKVPLRQDEKDLDAMLQSLAEIITAPSTASERRKSIYGEDPHAGYGGYIQQRRDGTLSVDGTQITKLYRVVNPGEWADAQKNGYLQSSGGGGGYTRASAKPDERWRHQALGQDWGSETGYTLEIDWDPEDKWSASAEGYAATHSRIPLSRVRRIDDGSHSADNTSVIPKDGFKVTKRTSIPAQGADNPLAVRASRGESGTEPDRRIPHAGETVDIYRDLGRGREFKRGFPDKAAFSVRNAASVDGNSSALVKASSVGIVLDQPRPSWAAAAKREAEATGKRGVHAFIRGEVNRYLSPDEANALATEPGWQEITYYPGTQDFFDPVTRRRFITAKQAVGVNGKFYVLGPEFHESTTPISEIEKKIQASITASGHVPDDLEWWDLNAGRLVELWVAAKALQKFHLAGLHDQRSHGHRFGGGTWGATHQGSRGITGAAAKIMGLGEWDDRSIANGDERYARSMLDHVAHGPALRETVWSGHRMPSEKVDALRVGEKMVFPLVATGDRGIATTFSSDLDRDHGQTVGVIYRFPPGTHGYGYSRNTLRSTDPEMWADPEYKYRWDEAIVSGRFEVTDIAYDSDSDRVVVGLSQTEVFDPRTSTWTQPTRLPDEDLLQIHLKEADLRTAIETQRREDEIEVRKYRARVTAERDAREAEFESVVQSFPPEQRDRVRQIATDVRRGSSAEPLLDRVKDRLKIDQDVEDLLEGFPESQRAILRDIVSKLHFSERVDRLRAILPHLA